MSNFTTFARITNALNGTAPEVFACSTPDNLGTITAAGYLNDLGDKVKLNDVFWINYSDTSTFPLGGSGVGEAATLGQFMVTVSGSNVSLTAYPAGAPASANLLSTSFANPDTASNIIFQDITVGQAALASGGHATLQASSGSKVYKVRNLWLNKVGTNFSGASGDRDIQITDGTSVWSIIPAATAQSLVNARWGDTDLPVPASVSFNTSSVAGSPIYIAYQGGTTDYTAGSLVLTAQLQRVA